MKIHPILRKILILPVAGSLLCGWSVQAFASCAGSCCVPPASGEATAPLLKGEGCCCCPEKPDPCGLSRSQSTELQPRAVASAPRVEGPHSCVIAFAASPDGATPSVHRSAPAQGRDPPPTTAAPPLYLRHDSFLC